jgi:ATP-dependent Clp protease ATP-binding subunit ClpX
MTTHHTLDSCSFCNKHKDSVAKLIVGDGVAICNECVTLCDNLLVDELPAVRAPVRPGLNPRDIKHHLDQYVIGQDQAKTVLSVAVVNHYKRINSADPEVEVEKTNILMLGPTGSGKTLLAKSVARYLDVPFVIADATSLTEAGYVGDDVESMIGRLYAASGNDVEKTQRGIVFIDEIDKISRKSESTSITRDVSGEGVQQALLKLVEGTVCRIPTAGNRKHPSSDTVEIDTRNILFIAAGAFVGMDQLVKSRTKGINIGFSAPRATNLESSTAQVTPEDIIRYGMIPEFVGRFQSWVSLEPLCKQDLIRILTEVKHNYVSQYQWLFAKDQVALEFSQSALDLLAERTLKNKTGARGLHTELERVLLPHMFNLVQYCNNGVTSLHITPHLVETPVALDACTSSSL